MEQFFNTLWCYLFEYIFKDGIVFWTAVMALAITITAGLAIKTLKESYRERKENYILDRQALSYRILLELNRNENISRTIRFLKVYKNKKLIINFDIYNFCIEKFDKSSLKRLLDSAVSFKDNKLILDISNIYNRIENIETLVKVLSVPERRGEEKFLFTTVNELHKNIYSVLKDIRKIYQRFNKEVDFDFINSKYYKPL